MLMRLYFVEWPDQTITIIYDDLSPIDLFWKLDEEGDPYCAKVWSTTEPCAITSDITPSGLVVRRNRDCLWRRSIMPCFERVQNSVKNT